MNSINQSIELIKAEIIALENNITVKQSEIETAYNNAIKEANRMKKEAEKEVTAELKNIEHLTVALTALGGKIEKSKPAKKSVQHPLLIVADNYESKMTVAEKIAFVLNEIGDEKTKEDIALSIAVKDETDLDKTIKTISGILSNLKGKGLLTTIKDGRKDLYSLVR